MLDIYQDCNSQNACLNSKQGDPDQTASQQSDLGLHCLSMPFWQATSVPNVPFTTYGMGP